MRVPLIRSAAGLFGLLMLALALWPMSAAWGASKTDVLNGDEAWFLANKEPLAELPTGDPTCQLPTGCNASGNAGRPAGPHPEGVLVVAANAGEDDAQTYFNFGDKLPLGSIVTGGTVSMPIATDPEAGNLNAEAAELVACLVTGFIPGGADAGSYKDRPEFDDKTCVEVVLAEDAETPTFTFNLERFGKAWSNGTAMNGVTILVNPEITPPAPDQTWRVAFNTARRHKNAADPKAFPPITSDLQFKAAPGLGPVDVPDEPLPPADTGGTGTTPPPPSTDTGGFDPGTSAPPPADSGTVPTDTGAAPPPATTDTPPVEDPVTAEGGEGAPAAAPAPPVVAAAAPGLSPAVWLLPLLALAMAGVLGWSLSAPVELAGQREGAVSKLMRNRRLAGDTTTA